MRTTRIASTWPGSIGCCALTSSRGFAHWAHSHASFGTGILPRRCVLFPGCGLHRRFLCPQGLHMRIKWQSSYTLRERSMRDSRPIRHPSSDARPFHWMPSIHGHRLGGHCNAATTRSLPRPYTMVPDYARRWQSCSPWRRRNGCGKRIPSPARPLSTCRRTSFLAGRGSRWTSTVPRPTPCTWHRINAGACSPGAALPAKRLQGDRGGCIVPSMRCSASCWTK